MKKTFYGLTLILLVIIANHLNVSAQSLTFDQTARHLFMGSSVYESETLSYETTYHELQSSNNLPDPELGGEFLAAPAGESNRWAAELTWEAEWPGVYHARGQEKDARINEAKALLKDKRRERLAEIKILLAEYIILQRKLTLIEELDQSNDSIYEIGVGNAKEGMMTVLDLNKIKLERANVKGMRAAVADEIMENIAALSSLYGKDCSGLLSRMELKLPDIYIPAEEELSEIAQKAPSVELADAVVEVAKAGEKVASRELLPSFGIGYKHAYEEGMHFNGGTLGISLPIFSGRKKKEAAKAAIKEADFNALAARESLLAELQQLTRRLGSMNERTKEIASVLDRGDQFELLLSAYREGVITLVDYLAERNYFINAEIEYLSLLKSVAIVSITLDSYMSADDFAD